MGERKRQGRGKRSASGSPRRSNVQSVERAGRIIALLFAAGPQGKRLSEISQETGLHKTTVTRLLHTLMAVGPVRKDDRTNRYYWEPLFWISIISGARQLLGIADMAQTALQELAVVCGETVVLARPDPACRTIKFVAVAYPSSLPDPIHHWYLGMAWPTHDTASGKVCLAALSDAELEAWRRRHLEAADQPAIASWEEFRRELRRWRKMGYAVQKRPWARECVLAVPLRDRNGKVAGALAVSGPPERMTPERIRALVPLAHKAAAKLSDLLHGALTPEAHRPANPPPGPVDVAPDPWYLDG